MAIIFVCRKFDVPQTLSSCENFVLIYDGLNTWSDVLKKYCEPKEGDDKWLNSSANVLRVEFSCGKHGTGGGFSAEYESIPVVKGTCEIWHFLNFRFLKVSLLCGFTPSPCDWSLSAQPISSQKAQPRKKSPQAFAHLMHFSKNVCIIRHCYFDSRINKPSTCSFWVICISLDVLPAQRSIAFFLS